MWPTFQNFPTEFVDGSWKCPFCSCCTPRIRQHLTNKHKDDIAEKEAIDAFCDAMAVCKRMETKRRADRKRDPVRSQKPERKEVKRKVMKKVNAKPER